MIEDIDIYIGMDQDGTEQIVLSTQKLETINNDGAPVEYYCPPSDMLENNYIIKNYMNKYGPLVKGKIFLYNDEEEFQQRMKQINLFTG